MSAFDIFGNFIGATKENCLCRFDSNLTSAAKCPFRSCKTSVGSAPNWPRSYSCSRYIRVFSGTIFGWTVSSSQAHACSSRWPSHINLCPARHGLTTSIVRKQVRNAHSLELGQSWRMPLSESLAAAAASIDWRWSAPPHEKMCRQPSPAGQLENCVSPLRRLRRRLY